jgi:hypothetical protein
MTAFEKDRYTQRILERIDDADLQIRTIDERTINQARARRNLVAFKKRLEDELAAYRPAAAVQHAGR